MKGRTTIEEGANTDRTDTTNFGGIRKRIGMFLGCFWDVLGIFGNIKRGWLAAYGVVRMGQKTNTDSTDVTDLSFHGSFFDTILWIFCAYGADCS